MKLSQNLLDRCLVAQLTRHGTKVKKLAQSRQLVRMGVRSFGNTVAAVRSRGGQRFHLGSNHRLHEHSLCATFVSAACCLFSLLYTFRKRGGFARLTGDSVVFFSRSVSWWHRENRHVPTFVYVLSSLVSQLDTHHDRLVSQPLYGDWNCVAWHGRHSQYFQQYVQSQQTSIHRAL